MLGYRGNKIKWHEAHFTIHNQYTALTYKIIKLHCWNKIYSFYLPPERTWSVIHMYSLCKTIFIKYSGVRIFSILRNIWNSRLSLLNVQAVEFTTAQAALAHLNTKHTWALFKEWTLKVREQKIINQTTNLQRQRLKKQKCHTVNVTPIW